MSAALVAGFLAPVFEAQAIFRAVLAALSRPGLRVPLATALTPPGSLTPELAAIALALADPDAPIWLDPVLAAGSGVAPYLRFHTGARIVDNPGDAVFALAADPLAMPDLADLATGTDAYPDRSTTLVLATRSLDDGPALTLAGPGIKDRVTFAPTPLPGDFALRLKRNAALFPRGIDILLVAPGAVAGIPRSSRVVAEAA